LSSAHVVFPGILRTGTCHERERTIFSSTKCVQATGHFNEWHKVVKQSNGRKKNKTNIKMCRALINDNADVACIADCGLDNYKGYALYSIFIWSTYFHRKHQVTWDAGLTIKVTITF
jgi:hypothetical protein